MSLRSQTVEKNRHQLNGYDPDCHKSSCVKIYDIPRTCQTAKIYEHCAHAKVYLILNIQLYCT